MNIIKDLPMTVDDTGQIAWLRKRAGMSQEALALAMVNAGQRHWHQTTVSRVERGKQELRMSEALSLLRILGEYMPSVPPAPQAPTASVAKLVGAQVKDVRAARGWTQEELASALRQAGHRISRVGVAKTESATRPVTVEDLTALAYVLEVPFTYFFPDDIADAGEDGTPRDRDE